MITETATVSSPTQIPPSKENTTKEENYSTLYRIIHWAIAITFLLLLLTIFLRLTWMNKDNVAAIIQEYLSDTGQVLSQEQLIVLAKKIRKPMWQWHTYLGYALTGLFALRFMLPLFGSMKFQNPFGKNLSSKDRFKNWVYIIFYVLVVISLSTGLVIDLGPKEYKKTMESIHELSIYYLVGFMVIHFAGVLIADSTNQKGIISRIISGSKKDT
jgi:cytochrome b561